MAAARSALKARSSGVDPTARPPQWSPVIEYLDGRQPLVGGRVRRPVAMSRACWPPDARAPVKVADCRGLQAVIGAGGAK